MTRLKKCIIKKGVTILLIIITILCTLAYLYITYALNIEASAVNTPNFNVAVFNTVKDVLTVIISILGTNLLVSLLIDVHSKNNLLTDIIENGVIADPKFYLPMEEDRKKEMLNALIENVYFDNIVTQNIFVDILNKLKGSINVYYFDKCEYIVSCNIYDRYIEKTITKKIEIKSFQDNATIQDFGIGSFASKKIEGLESFELASVEVNGEKLKLDSEDIRLVQREASNLDEQNQYDSYGRYVYAKALQINNKNSVKISVKCVTRTSYDDTVSTFRVTRPCRNFSLVYSLKQHEKYRLAVDAFGFLDDADDSTNNMSDSNINIKFDDWIFENDGVVVSILKK